MISKTILIGNVGSIERKGQVVSATLCTNRKYTKQDGEKVSDQSWHRLTFFESGRNLASVAERFVKKGSKIYIEGQLKYGKFTDKEGIERNTVQIIVNELQLLDSKADSEQNSKKAEPASDFDDSDIPF